MHPAPNSLVVESSSTKTPAKGHPTPANKEGRKLEILARRMYSMTTFILCAVNYLVAMGAYQKQLWSRVLPALEVAPEDIRQLCLNTHAEALTVSKYQRLAARHVAEATSKNFASIITLRRHAWLCSANIVEDIKSRVENLPFDASGLFSQNTDENLENLHKSKKTAKSYSIQPQSKPTKFQWRSRYATQTYQNHLRVPTILIVANLLIVLLRPPLPLLLSNHNHLTRSSLTKHLERNRNSTFDFLTTTPSICHTTHLSPYLHNWTLITQDNWVLSIINSSYCLEFIELPPLGQVNPTSFNPVLEEEILTLLQKEAIQVVSPKDILNGFYSRYFLVPKKDSGLRPILDLRNLNKFLKARLFRMMTLESIIHLLREGDWFVVVDLKDAYFHITTHRSHRKYLRLLFNNTVYQLVALPFGLSTAPRTFTKCMAPVAAYLRLQGVQIYPYIDDWLIVSKSKHQALRDTQYVLQTLESLGLTINYEKSKLRPSRVVDYIGARIDSIRAQMFMPPERIQKILGAIKKFKPHARVKAKLAQHLIGLVASTTSTLSHACLKMRSLQVWKLTLFSPLHNSQNKCLTVTPELAQQLQWWTFLPHLLVGRPFRPLQLTTQVTTDASPLGWGAHCKGHQIHALWSHQEKELHINHLELLAVIKALKAFLPLVRGRVIQLVTDNTMTMFYVNKRGGGTKSRFLLLLSIHLWEWCYQEHIYPVATHISTTDNLMVDELSRRSLQNHEWELDFSVFQTICDRWGTPCIDIFATLSNKKCHDYASRAGIGQGSLGVAQTTLVLSASTNSCRQVEASPHSTPNHSGLGVDLPSGCGITPLNSVEDIPSKEVLGKARKPSTIRLYQHKWQGFLKFATERGLQSSPVSLSTLLLYLQHLFDLGLTKSEGLYIGYSNLSTTRITVI
ncbi:uncharacterized protein LOC144586699 [Pogona vitticeps]